MILQVKIHKDDDSWHTLQQHMDYGDTLNVSDDRGERINIELLQGEEMKVHDNSDVERVHDKWHSFVFEVPFEDESRLVRLWFTKSYWRSCREHHSFPFTFGMWAEGVVGNVIDQFYFFQGKPFTKKNFFDECNHRDIPWNYTRKRWNERIRKAVPGYTMINKMRREILDKRGIFLPQLVRHLGTKGDEE